MAALGALPMLGVLTLSIYLACAIGVLVALGRMARTRKHHDARTRTRKCWSDPSSAA